MARHRSEAPSAPRQAPNVPVDPYGDPVDVTRATVAAPPAGRSSRDAVDVTRGAVSAPPPGRSVAATASPSPPFGFPASASEPARGPVGLPGDPLSAPVGALEPTALEPTARALGAERAWSPAVPATRAGEGRHAWAVEPDVEPVIPPATRHRAAPPAPVPPRDVTPPARPGYGDRSLPRVPRTPEPREASGRSTPSGTSERPASSGTSERPASSEASARPASSEASARSTSSGRAVRGGGHDPETNPLDLAAIALAEARTATGSHRFGPTGGLPGLAARSGPLAVPSTGGHRVTGGPRGLSPTRTAGALAVAGALVSAGVAVLSSGSMLASAESNRTAAEPPAATQQNAGDR